MNKFFTECDPYSDYYFAIIPRTGKTYNSDNDANHPCNVLPTSFGDESNFQTTLENKEKT